MHTVEDSEFEKIVQALKAGPDDIAHRSAVEIGFRWLEEHEVEFLKLTDGQEKTLKESLSALV
ncbi:hypothetical protein QWJ20_01265 [Pectobacterium sp. S5]|uniref:hypothetical protein n=1 Tax=Pectobacterium TaxID=122277 RepID=UPI003D9AD768